jgi:hypothetical protein
MATQKVRREPGALERQVEKQRRAVRNRRVGALATVAVLIGVAAATYTLGGGDTQGGPASPAVSPPTGPGSASSSMVDLDTGEITPLPDSIAGATYYAVSPDHTRVAYSTCCTPPAPLFVANLDGTGIRRVTPEGQDAFGAQWSPDGSLLVYQQRDASTLKLGNLFALDVNSGRRTQLTDLDQTHGWDWWFMFPSFGSSDGWILFQLPRGDPRSPVWDLWEVPITGGEPVIAHHDAGWGAFRRSGYRDLAFLSPVSAANFTGGALWTTSFDSRIVQPHALVRNGTITWPRWSPDGSRISYSDGGWVYVVNVATGPTTGEITKVAVGGNAEWYDDHTLIVGDVLG